MAAAAVVFWVVAVRAIQKSICKRYRRGQGGSCGSNKVGAWL